MLHLILLIAVIGFVVWLVIHLVPMPSPFPQIIIAVACLAVLYLVLSAIGFVDVPVPRVGR